LDFQNLAYAITQIAHNFGAVTVVGGAVFALVRREVEQQHRLAWIERRNVWRDQLLLLCKISRSVRRRSCCADRKSDLRSTGYCPGWVEIDRTRYGSVASIFLDHPMRPGCFGLEFCRGVALVFIATESENNSRDTCRKLFLKVVIQSVPAHCGDWAFGISCCLCKLRIS